MSRSLKKNPFCSWTCCGDRAGNQKKYKQAEHRRQRRAVRLAIFLGRDLPHDRQFGNTWTSPKDGKQRWLDVRCLRK